MSDTQLRFRILFTFLVGSFFTSVSAEALHPNFDHSTNAFSACARYQVKLIGIDDPNDQYHKNSDDIALLSAHFERAFPPNDIEILVNQDASRTALFNSINSVTKQDTDVCILIYYAGKVTNRKLGNHRFRSYLPWFPEKIPTDTLSTAGLSFGVIADALTKSKAAAILLIVNNQVAGSQAMYSLSSGPGPPTSEHDANQPRYLFSTTSRDKNLSEINGRQHSILALALIDGLLNRQGDLNTDGEVVVLELVEYLEHLLPALSVGGVHFKARAFNTTEDNIVLTENVPIISIDDPIDQYLQSFRDDQEVFLPPRALLKVSSTPKDARLSVDGTVLGTTPLQNLSVPAGEITVELLAEDHFVWRQSIFLEPDSTVMLYPELLYRYGQVSFSNLPNSSRLTINDSLAFDLDGQPLRIPIGNHKAVLHYDQGAHLDFDIQLTSNEEQNYLFLPNAPALGQAFQSILVPGRGQHLDGAPLKGHLYMGGIILSGLTLFISDRAYRKALTNYERTFDAYINEEIESRAQLLWDDTVQKFDKANQVNTFRIASLGAIAGFYAINILDAFVFHSRRDQIRAIQTGPGSNLSFQSSWNPRELNITLSLTL